jgi:hypothetical protein
VQAGNRNLFKSIATEVEEGSKKKRGRERAGDKVVVIGMKWV